MDLIARLSLRPLREVTTMVLILAYDAIGGQVPVSRRAASPTGWQMAHGRR